MLAAVLGKVDHWHWTIDTIRKISILKHRLKKLLVCRRLHLYWTSGLHIHVGHIKQPPSISEILYVIFKLTYWGSPEVHWGIFVIYYLAGKELIFSTPPQIMRNFFLSKERLLKLKVKLPCLKYLWEEV